MVRHSARMSDDSMWGEQSAVKTVASWAGGTAEKTAVQLVGTTVGWMAGRSAAHLVDCSVA